MTPSNKLGPDNSKRNLKESETKQPKTITSLCDKQTVTSKNTEQKDTTRRVVWINKMFKTIWSFIWTVLHIHVHIPSFYTFMQASVRPDPASLGQRLGELIHMETGRLVNSSLKISNPHSVPHVSHDVIQKVKDKSGSEMLKKIYSHAAYAMGYVRNAQGNLLHIRVLIDSGNLIKTGVAISEKFHKQLVIGYSQQNTCKVGITGKGSTMIKLGKSNDFRLRIEGISKVFIMIA